MSGNSFIPQYVDGPVGSMPFRYGQLIFTRGGKIYVDSSDDDRGGGGGSGYVNPSYLISTVNVQPTEVGFVSNPVTDGNGYVRITKT